MESKNNGKQWTSAELSHLQELARGNMPIHIISVKVHHTLPAVQSKATTKGLPGMPTDQSSSTTASPNRLEQFV
ncbi:hypothetical protein [Polaromonas sp. JS666]|uniref:hypothetical protein n=1 Tax=Polaromonas sp. (strain JS666 / ATCC BAA-500) TaxID=296591 RepID=UPI0012ECCC35|nr:hypothetical protein [Polaromonas sp. JS666]